MPTRNIWQTRIAGEAADRHAGALLRRFFDDQIAVFFNWTPVFLAAGIAAYFALPLEPPLPAFAVLTIICAGMVFLAWRFGQQRYLAVAIFLGGILLVKTHVMLLDTRLLLATTGTVEVTGEVLWVESRPKNRHRYRLRVHHISKIKPERWPEIVRISTPGPIRNYGPGDVIKATARLFPLAAPVEPGGFDFGRRLWFKQIGATGFALKPAEIISYQSGVLTAVSRYIYDVRREISVRIRNRLEGDKGGLAVALIIGERGLVAEAVAENLRLAGLAHILAISGLHMSLVAGGLFWLLRAALAMSPVLALNYPIKKWAAVTALIAAAAYLTLSGGAIATQRAFIMLVVMFGAVLLNRPALSMRNLALAGLVVLFISPAAVLGPSFQMSFMAVMGLIAAYEIISNWRERANWRSFYAGPGIMGTFQRHIANPLLAIALTTSIASIMTGIPAAYHFHRLASFSVLANLFALPAVTLLVMPMAFLSVLAMPFGLEAPFLALMGLGLHLVIEVAGYVAHLPGAAMSVARLSMPGVLLLSSSVLLLCLLQGRWRALMVMPLAISLIYLIQNPARPDILIERLARNVAARSNDGQLVPATHRRGRFSVENWLRADGDFAPLRVAAQRQPWQCVNKACRFEVKGKKVLFLREEEGFKPAICSGAEIVIADFPLYGACPGPQIVIDRFDLWRNGAHALTIREDFIRVETAVEAQGKRPWAVTRVPRDWIRSESLFRFQ